MPLPDRDFDVTEVAVPWRVLRDAGHQIVFATEQAGTVPAADPRLLTGVLFGQLGAAPQAKGFYQELSNAEEFTATAGWAELDPAAFDGLLLPGGHAPGMRQYLGSAVLREPVPGRRAAGSATDVELAVALGHRRPPERQHPREHAVTEIQAGHLGEDPLRSPDHPAGPDVVGRAVPGAHQAAVLIDTATR